MNKPRSNGLAPREPRGQWMRRLLVLAAALFATTPALAASCDSLASLSLPNTKILETQSVPAGPYKPAKCTGAVCPTGDLPAFCRVTANISAAADSATFIEMWLPSADWNERLQSIGNHGFGGNVYYVDMAEALKRGFATVATDTGHPAGVGPFDASFAVGHPQKLVDFAYRATHEMTLRAKDIMAAFYGRPASYTYFNGCSNGGRQALMEALRYPGDYNGIIAGGAAANWTHAATEQLVMANALAKTSASHLSSPQMSMVSDAVFKQCGIGDPRSCRLDPKDLVCKPGQDAGSCLNPDQAAALAAIHAPMRDPVTNKLLFLGQEKGAEFDWVKFKLAEFGSPFPVANYRYIVFNDPAWNGLTLDLHNDLPMLDALGGVLNVTDPDLAAFKAAGGKLIQYHGWNDSQFTPGWTVHYYDEVVHAVGGGGDGQALARTQDFYRLFMMPGVGHCTGGPGPNTIGGLQQAPSPSLDAAHDVVSALQQWVEHHAAPDRIIATKYNDDDPARGIASQKPICAFPAEPRYLGTGDRSAAASYECQGHSIIDEWATLEAQ